MGKSNFKKMLETIGINDPLTEAPPKKRFNTVKTNLNMKQGYNYMSDLVELEPTKSGFKYLLTLVDLAIDRFDCEPLKTKTSAEVLKALQTIFRRRGLKQPKMSLTTDGGSEFKNVFHNWLVDKEIDHKVTLPYRHQQMGNVESLNNQIGRMIGLMSNEEIHRTNKTDVDWTKFLNNIRKNLNEYREKPEPSSNPIVKYDLDDKPKYKVGDWVHRLSNQPHDVLGNKFERQKFRQGDLRYDYKPSQISKILIMPMETRKPVIISDDIKREYKTVQEYKKEKPDDNARSTPNFRYMLVGYTNVSYAENELKPAKTPANAQKGDEQRIVQKILKRGFDKTTREEIFQVKWAREGNSKFTEKSWEPANTLRQQVPNMIDEFLNENPQQASLQPPTNRPLRQNKNQAQLSARPPPPAVASSSNQPQHLYGLRSRST